MPSPTRPLLVLPPASAGTVRAGGGGGGSTVSPRKGRLVERLDPTLAQLAAVTKNKAMELSASPGGVAPELVVVFETNTSASEFAKALKATPELAWLAEVDVEDRPPDEDYYDLKDPMKTLSARWFLVMANHQAIDELLRLWRLWADSTPARLPQGHRHWSKAFACLRDVHVWGPDDRVRETGLAEDWEHRKALGQQTAPVEIELWFRDAGRRNDAAGRVRRDVAAAGGVVLSESTIPEIAYHALLAELPTAAVEGLLKNRAVALLRSEDVHFFRPVPQQPPSPRTPPVDDDDPSPRQPRGSASGAPFIALLDGLPQQNHALLQGQLVVDDPDGWEATYPANARRHGTAMASLLARADLGSGAEPSARPIYVRPILRPRLDAGEQEEAPQRELLVDVVHRAVVRIVGAPGVRAAAPSVRVVNLSIGDRHRPYLGQMSPLARLLDWLAWKHDLLFVVSAGNHVDDLLIAPGTESDEVRALRAVQEGHRHRRLLSPAESLNALTVGAAHLDDAGIWERRNADEVQLLETAGLPSPISALGRGHRKSVKPDVLAPGGRVVFDRQVGDRTRHKVSTNRTRFPPGQRVAAPGLFHGQPAEVYTFGTSNAAALTSRAAGRLLEAVAALKASADGAMLTNVSDALLAKALLVHTSSWTADANSVLESALKNDQNTRRWHDHLCAFIGYGLLHEERGLECLQTRATLVGGGRVAVGSAVAHRVPLPASLHTHTGTRSWIATLAWFSPISTTDRRYRLAALDLMHAGLVDRLAVKACDADGNVAKRGTLQHVVMRGDRRVVTTGDDDEVVLNITATSEIDPDDRTEIPYALAVTVEVAETARIDVYEAVRQRLRARVAVPAGRG